jgi:hypothetical protein
MPSGTRIPGLRFDDPRVHVLLQALLIHRLLPRGFTNPSCAPSSRPSSAQPPRTSPPGK